MTKRDPAAATAVEPLRNVRYPARGPRPSWRRRIGVGVLCAVVLAGALGLLGVRSATATASDDGYVLVVTYPQIARAGLDVPWRVEVRHDGGFEDEVTLRVTA
nr:hypothetical protein [Micromonospora sp. DSM 115978]